jgi:hypothetical protein
MFFFYIYAGTAVICMHRFCFRIQSWLKPDSIMDADLQPKGWG